MAYLALLVPLLALPVLLAMAAFESRCSDGSPLWRRRVPAPGAPAELPAGSSPTRS
ncbi:hypothetical protein WDZ17_13000 [Pseudokineococcus basanitobsidens]|uniref:Uncharacterized protein n=1 Tax=Pseudokineococcus basanitobsidens TaxID=1926649 RepID=A0ABU8RM88_9ACTN